MSWQERDRTEREALQTKTKNLSGILVGTATWDPPSVAAAAEATTSVTVTGAAMGDVALVGFSLNLPASVHLRAHVSAADTVTVSLRNNSGGAVDLGSGTVKVSIIK